MILECDFGNTRCKWRLIDDGDKPLSSGVFDHTNNPQGLPDLKGVDRIRVISVAYESVMHDFVTSIETFSGVVDYASVTSVKGMRCAYDNPSQLGVDRWSAIVAAYKKYGASLVIDVGSALTVDAVDSAGQHLGGYITPGLGLMESSLLKDTSKVRFQDLDYKHGLSFGVSTLQAVSGGLLAAQVGVARVAIDEAGRRIPEEFAILLTGGDAEIVGQHLNDRVVYHPDLVLDGLKWLLP